MSNLPQLSKLLLFFISIVQVISISISGGNYTNPKVSRSPVYIDYTGLTFPGGTSLLLVFQAFNSTIGTNNEIIFGTPLPNSVLINRPYQIVASSVSTGTVVLDPFPSSADSNTTFYVITAIKASSWLCSSSYSKKLTYWPSIGDTMDGESKIFVDGEFTYDGVSGSAFSRPASEILTVAAETILYLNDTVRCLVSIRSTGIVRAGYLNGDYWFSGASKFDYFLDTVISDLVDFSAGYHTITLFGTNINPILSIGSCYDAYGNLSEYVKIERYYRSNVLHSSSLVTYYYKYICDPGCLICSPVCQKCSSGYNYGSMCYEACTTFNADAFSSELDGSLYCGDKIEPRITSTSMIYNNASNVLSFSFRGEILNQDVILSVYANSLKDQLKSDSALLLSPIATLGLDIFTTSIDGNFSGTLTTSQNLYNYYLASPAFTVVVNSLKTNKIRVSQYNKVFDVAYWTQYIGNGENISYWTPNYVILEIVYKCASSPCPLTIYNDGVTQIYLNGAAYSSIVNQTSVTQTDLSLPQTGVLLVRISSCNFLKISTPATIYGRSDYIYNSEFCLDDTNSSVIKSCTCVFPCQDCASEAICRSCYPGMDLASGGCNCNTPPTTVPDPATKTCRCLNGLYFDAVFNNCSGKCDSTCKTCSDSTPVCESCQAPRVLNSSTSACDCYFPWNVTGNCSGCLGFLEGLDCVTSCSPDASIDFINRECVICSSDFDCRKMPSTPYCSMNTTYCVGFQASISPIFINKINPSLGIELTAAVIDSYGVTANLADYEYIWEMDYNFPSMSIGNNLRIFPFLNISGYPKTFDVKLLVKHLFTGNVSMATKTISINQRPLIHTIHINPSTGLALQDYFNFTVVASDSELDFPLTVKWYYMGSDIQRILLADTYRSLSYIGKLPMGFVDIGLNKKALLILAAQVTDTSGLVTEITFGIITGINYISTKQASNVVSSANTSDVNSLKNVSETLQNLVIQDRDKLKFASNPCLINCNNNGYCNNGTCVCRSGFFLPDCSMTLSQYLYELELKGQVLDYIEKVCTEQTLVSNTTIYSCFEILTSITSNVYLNSPSLGTRIINIALKFLGYIKALKLDDQTLIQIAGLIDNLLDFPSFDCSKTNSFGFTVLDNIKYFIEYLHLLLVNTLNLESSISAITMGNFRLHAQRIYTANVAGKTFKPSNLLATDPYIIFPSTGFTFSDASCSIQFILWNPTIFDCSKTEPLGVTLNLKKDLSLLDLDYTLGAYYQIIYPSVPSGFTCPGTCIMQSGGTPTVCGCIDKKTLTIDDYLTRSEPSQNNVSQDVTYDNYHGTIVLNAVIGSLCFVHILIGILLDIKKKKDIGVDINAESHFSQSCSYLMVTHCFFSTFFKYDPDNPRALRSFLFYLRLLGFEVFGFLFISLDSNYPPLISFFLKVSTVFMVALYSKVIYDLLINNDIIIGHRGDLKVKKKLPDQTIVAVSKSLGYILTLAVFALSVAGIVILLNENADVNSPFFNDAFTIFYNCLLIDFFAFQFFKIFVEIWIMSITSTNLIKSRRIRSFARSIVERYFLRYYTIFWIKERRNLQNVAS